MFKQNVCVSFSVAGKSKTLKLSFLRTQRMKSSEPRRAHHATVVAKRRDGVINRIRALYELGLVRHSCNSHKLIAARLALQGANLITLLDETYQFGNGNGRSKKWGLGKNALEYQEFCSLQLVHDKLMAKHEVATS